MGTRRATRKRKSEHVDSAPVDEAEMERRKKYRQEMNKSYARQSRHRKEKYLRDLEAKIDLLTNGKTTKYHVDTIIHLREELHERDERIKLLEALVNELNGQIEDLKDNDIKTQSDADTYDYLFPHDLMEDNLPGIDSPYATPNEDLPDPLDTKDILRDVPESLSQLQNDLTKPVKSVDSNTVLKTIRLLLETTIKENNILRDAISRCAVEAVISSPYARHG